MTNTEVQTDNDVEMEIGPVEGLMLSHEVGLVKFQVNLTTPHIADTYLYRKDQTRIATTLAARSDVTRAYVGPEGYLHVHYDPKGLTGAKRDAFVKQLKAKVVDVIEHKLVVLRKEHFKKLAEESSS